MPVRSVDYVIIYAESLDRSVDFYRDVVGLPLKFVDAGYAEFDTGVCRFAVYERRRADWLTSVATAPGPAAEVVFIVDSVDAEAARLGKLGVTLLAEPADRPWGHRTLHLADPDGFIVELAEEIPRTRSRRTLTPESSA